MNNQKYVCMREVRTDAWMALAIPCKMIGNNRYGGTVEKEQDTCTSTIDGMAMMVDK